MEDQILGSVAAFASITSAAMIFSEWAPLRIPGLKSKIVGVKDSPWRKRVSCFVYSYIAGLGAWGSGYFETPLQGWRGFLGVLVVAAVATVTAFAVVKAKKVLAG